MHRTTLLTRISMAACLVVPALAQDPAPQHPSPKQPASQPASQPADAGATDAAKPKILQLGQRADGALTLLDIDGKPQNAHELMGRITVVNFYSIQCPVQRAWDKRLAAIQQDFAKDGVVFLHVDSNVGEIGEEPQQKEGEELPYGRIRDHLQAQQLPFRVLVDHGNKVADFFDAKTTPHVYVFGKDGRLVYKGLVDDDQKDRRVGDRHDYLRDTLAKLLKGEKVEPFATKETGCGIKRVAKKDPAVQRGLQHLGGDGKDGKQDG